MNEKYIKDGKVAIILDDYQAFNIPRDDYDIISLLLEGNKQKEIYDIILQKKKYYNDCSSLHGHEFFCKIDHLYEMQFINGLHVSWVKLGEKYKFNYCPDNMSEWIEVYDEKEWFTA